MSPRVGKVLLAGEDVGLEVEGLDLRVEPVFLDTGTAPPCWRQARNAVGRLLGISNVFRINGPAGIAALGFGTESIPRVRKVVGPGSPAVTIAQVEMQRFGVATMMVLGPTEEIAWRNAREVAEILGVSRQRASELASSAGFPRPVANLAAGPVWLLSSINSFNEKWERRPGRPRPIWEQQL